MIEVPDNIDASHIRVARSPGHHHHHHNGGGGYGEDYYGGRGGNYINTIHMTLSFFVFVLFYLLSEIVLEFEKNICYFKKLDVKIC